MSKTQRGRVAGKRGIPIEADSGTAAAQLLSRKEVSMTRADALDLGILILAADVVYRTSIRALLRRAIGMEDT